MQSEHDYEIMKLENKIDDIKSQAGKKQKNLTFQQILKEQIAGIEKLKAKIKEKNDRYNQATKT